MKKITISVIAGAFLFLGISDQSLAQTSMNSQDEKEMSELSAKLVRMKKSVDQFANELASAYSDQRGVLSSFGQDVRVDIAENPEEYIVKADLPGMDKDKITVTLEGGRVLKIAGSREAIKEETGPNMVKRERMEGKFERVIELPAECKSEGISASYKNGVLEVIIPKKESAKPEMIKVNIK